MIKQIFKSASILALTLPLMSPSVMASVLDEIKEKGTLVVAVKADYKPYGFRNSSGEIMGLEVDLAKDVAKRLGVALELVPVQSSNRMQFLAQGKVDLMIATMTDKPDRRKVVFASDPNYYSSGTNVLAWKSLKLKSWGDLRGKKVCGSQGSYYNKMTAQTVGAKIVAFKGTAEALTALSQGSCAAFVFDDSFIVSKLKDSQWSQKFEMPLETIDDAPWALAVRNGETEFHDYMNNVIVDWHKTGLILELENSYGLKNTPFAEKMHTLFK